MTYQVYQIDAFTKTMFKGNPAGVVTNATGLSEAQMLQIAQELNNSETAFLFPPQDTTHDGIIRYFTPTTEVPICGHATIAAMYAKAVEEQLDACVLQMKTNIGILPFEILKEGNDYKITMTQGKIIIDEPLGFKTSREIITALRLTTRQIDERCPLQIISTGHSKVMIGVRNREILTNLRPDLNQLKNLSKAIDCNGYYVFTLDTQEKDCLVNGRMFAPAIGVAEDPVTGNANGPLGAYLVHHQLVDTNQNTFRYRGKQGEVLDRTGYVEVEVSIEANQPTQVKISGDAMIVFKTTLDL